MSIKDVRRSPDLASADPEVRESLRRLPDRRPAEDEPTTTRAVQWERVDFDRYEVRVDATTVGHVEAVGAVFVALRGADYARSVEVLQTLLFDHAVEALATRPYAKETT